MKNNKPIEENIRKYMQIKGIKKYSELLRYIGKKLKVKDPYEFSNNEKSNFSKMLKGERPLKYEFIIPLEEIFGVPLSKILNEDKYLIEINKEDIPYIKGFRYYAYKDEYKLYKNLDEDYVSSNLYPYLQMDEYDKYFIDYLIEYQSINGFKFLVKEHGFKVNGLSVYTYTIDDNIELPYQNSNKALIKTIIGFDDVNLYKDIYGECYFLLDPRYRGMSTVYYNYDNDDDNVFGESILNTTNIFKTIFEYKEFKFEYFNPYVYPKSGLKPNLKLLNPLINICLDAGLKKLDKYKLRVIEILKFGIKYNKEVLSKIDKDIMDRCYTEINGALYYHSELLSSIVVINKDIDIKDKEVGRLINELPKLK